MLCGRKKRRRVGDRTSGCARAQAEVRTGESGSRDYGVLGAVEQAVIM
jgi:hypothetical protein